MCTKNSKNISKRKHNLKQMLISFDQSVNCSLGTIISVFKPSYQVWADETLSACLYRNRSYKCVDIIRILVDALFFIFTWKKEHCKRSYESELNRLHLPDEERKK